VLTPTRELAAQVAKVVEDVSAGRDIRVALLYGGTAPGPQRAALRQGAQVVVGTPGRVLDLLSQGALWLDQVRFLVLDEADEMFDQGFAQDVERIIERTANSRQTALFSATMPDWVRKLAERYLYDPVTITVDADAQSISAVPHIAFDVPVPSGSRRHDDEQLAKFRALCDLLDHRGPGAVIVFGRTKQGVQLLARRLEQAGYPVAALQGNLTQAERDHVMAAFKSGAVDILVATNVAARGLDLLDVTLVINFELPESAELLTHRVGRTGRMGRSGGAITLLAPSEARRWSQLIRNVGNRIERRPWPGAEPALAALRELIAEGQASGETEEAAAVETQAVKPAPSSLSLSDELREDRPASRHRGQVQRRLTVVNHGSGGAEGHVRQAAERDRLAEPVLSPKHVIPRSGGTLRPPWVLDAAARVARWQRGEPAVTGYARVASRPVAPLTTPSSARAPQAVQGEAAPIPSRSSPAPGEAEPAKTPLDRRSSTTPRQASKRSTVTAARPQTDAPPRQERAESLPAARRPDAARASGHQARGSGGSPKPPDERLSSGRQPPSNRSLGRVATGRCAACGAPIFGQSRYCEDCARELQRLNQRTE
jgi:ATP-dependent RNA helicase DeaD